jgi:hypothetical protein
MSSLLISTKVKQTVLTYFFSIFLLLSYPSTSSKRKLSSRLGAIQMPLVAPSLGICFKPSKYTNLLPKIALIKVPTRIKQSLELTLAAEFFSDNGHDAMIASTSPKEMLHVKVKPGAKRVNAKDVLT